MLKYYTGFFSVIAFCFVTLFPSYGSSDEYPKDSGVLKHATLTNDADIRALEDAEINRLGELMIPALSKFVSKLSEYSMCRAYVAGLIHGWNLVDANRVSIFSRLLDIYTPLGKIDSEELEGIFIRVGNSTPMLEVSVQQAVLRFAMHLMPEDISAADGLDERKFFNTLGKVDAKNAVFFCSVADTFFTPGMSFDDRIKIIKSLQNINYDQLVRRTDALKPYKDSFFYEGVFPGIYTKIVCALLSAPAEDIEKIAQVIADEDYKIFFPSGMDAWDRGKTICALLRHGHQNVCASMQV